MTAIPDISDTPAPIVQGEPVEVADGVFVIPDRRVPLVPNIGIVVGERAALVVDTGLGPRNGARVLAQARQLAGDRPLYLTTTHFHPEHGFGAQAFAGAATFVANRSQLDELRAKGAGYLAMFREFGPQVAAELADVEFVEPDLRYDERLDIDLGGHIATLRAHGPAHTSGDQTVLVDGRALFTGDLVETRMFPITPYFPPHDTQVDPAGWIGVLDELIALGPDVVVPGHGEVTELSTVRAVRDYLRHIVAEVARLHAAGASLDDATAHVDQDARDRWPDWQNPEWIGFAVRALYPKTLNPM
ncbi:MAG TPA: MBL fold metallo-hydrolase [Pseudonocardiaceae bacterium]|jgi:glyoxylase-like metal-dependent hydrolase (beta-lactamase superfamily II)